ncbi:MAG: hypothetical protein ACOYXC_13915 [Candidatus Rifleibacteriota bacterium]
MKLAKGMILGAWFLVVVNLLLAFGAIGVFNRMSPAINDILSNNERSLQACEEMLSAMVFAQCGSDADQLKNFKSAFDRAKNNITEKDEPEILEIIKNHHDQAFSGNKDAVKQTVEAILRLGNINRQAMEDADKRARQLGQGGAWGIVFMALCSFLTGVIFIRNLNKRLLAPLEELKNVLQAHLGGETRRRCTGANLPEDIRSIFGSMNSVLDRSMHDTFRK